MTVGERIKKRREALNLSQGELASIMNITRQAVSKAELHDSNITMDKVRKFAQALECTEAYLMGWGSESIEETLTEAYIKGQEVKELTPNTEEEKTLIRSFRELDEESQRQIVLMLAFLKEQNKK